MEWKWSNNKWKPESAVFPVLHTDNTGSLLLRKGVYYFPYRWLEEQWPDTWAEKHGKASPYTVLYHRVKIMDWGKEACLRYMGIVHVERQSMFPVEIENRKLCQCSTQHIGWNEKKMKREAQSEMIGEEKRLNKRWIKVKLIQTRWIAPLSNRRVHTIWG